VEALEPLEHDNLQSNRHRGIGGAINRHDGAYASFAPFRHVPAVVNARLKRLLGICVACDPLQSEESESTGAPWWPDFAMVCCSTAERGR